jgi:hypothetical protein
MLPGPRPRQTPARVPPQRFLSRLLLGFFTCAFCLRTTYGLLPFNLYLIIKGEAFSWFRPSIFAVRCCLVPSVNRVRICSSYDRSYVTFPIKTLRYREQVFLPDARSQVPYIGDPENEINQHLRLGNFPSYTSTPTVARNAALRGNCGGTRFRGRCPALLPPKAVRERCGHRRRRSSTARSGSPPTRPRS